LEAKLKKNPRPQIAYFIVKSNKPQMTVLKFLKKIKKKFVHRQNSIEAIIKKNKNGFIEKKSYRNRIALKKKTLLKAIQRRLFC